MRDIWENDMQISVKFDFSKTKRHLEGVKNAVPFVARNYCIESGMLFKRKYQERCPRRTGRLANSMGNPSAEGIWEELMLPNGYVVIVGTKVPYAGVVERGLAPRIIEPKKAKSIRFITPGGNVVYTKKISHPGYQGKWIMMNSFIETNREMLAKYNFGEFYKFVVK